MRAIPEDQQQSLPAAEMLRAWEAQLPTHDHLATAAELERLASMAAAARLTYLAKAAQDPPADRVQLSVPEQVHAEHRHTIKVARADVRLAQRLTDQYWVVGEAWRAGDLSEAQARAIVLGLRNLPPSVSTERLAAAQRDLVAWAGELDPQGLRRAAEHMVYVLDPDHADELEMQRLEREAREAHQRRFVTLTNDHHGSILLKGSLPVADGELLQAQLDALLPAATTYLHDEQQIPTKPARRADALIRLAQMMAATGTVPAHGGDRPHVVVTVSHDSLISGLVGSNLVASGAQIPAGEARRLACDAHVTPAVLGSDSAILDVGRTHRLFSKELRTSLVLRDQGCAFPSCDATPSVCEGHHIIPWHSDERGETSLQNGVLVCAYHHRMVEPDPRRRLEHQWKIHLDDRGFPVFTPPVQVDIKRRPRQHQRYRLRQPQPISAA